MGCNILWCLGEVIVNLRPIGAPPLQNRAAVARHRCPASRCEKKTWSCGFEVIPCPCLHSWIQSLPRACTSDIKKQSSNWNSLKSDRHSLTNHWCFQSQVLSTYLHPVLKSTSPTPRARSGGSKFPYSAGGIKLQVGWRLSCSHFNLVTPVVM